MEKLKNQNASLDKLAELIPDTRFGMLTMIGDDGSFKNWPVSMRQIESEDELWFLAKCDPPMTEDVRRHRQVSVCYSQPTDCSHVAISGICELITDSSKAEELWSEYYRHWLPGGPRDPSLVLARITVERADDWQGGAGRVRRSPGELVIRAGDDDPDPKIGDSPEHDFSLGLENVASPLIITNDPCPSCSSDIVRCSHRTYAYTLGQGPSTYEAAEDLLRRLSSQRDTVADHWHRGMLEGAIKDVQVFLSQRF
jgi:general stress protein 26